MKNNATIKPPIPVHRGIPRQTAFCLLYSVFSLARPSCPACLRSTLVETPLQIPLFFAKRTQFSQRQTQHNSLCRKGLPKKTTTGHSKKTNPIEPKQTQFQNGQYKHKYSKNKGLCQRTTNNEQRMLFKTNPIEPNSPACNPFFRSKMKVHPRKSNFSPPATPSILALLNRPP
jgi:hypothetical protein